MRPEMGMTINRDLIESYARNWLCLKHWHSVIGLRADEPRRVWRTL